MSTLCLLLCDGVRARLYRGTRTPVHLELVFHQMNFGGQLADFARSLGTLLEMDLRANRFDDLVVMGSPEFLEALDACLTSECRAKLVGKLVLEPGNMTEQYATGQLHKLLAAQAPRAPGE